MARTARGLAVALIVGGLLLILTNGVLSPMLPTDQSEAVLRTSDIYLVRLTAAGLVAFLLLLGSLGILLAHGPRVGGFGTLAFLTAVTGNTLMVAVEWGNVFLLRPIAQIAPSALEGLDDVTLVMVGYASAVGLFSLGWLLLTISTWRNGLVSRTAALIVLGGLLLIPVLGASPLGMVGAIAGNLVFGAGLAVMGYQLARRTR